MTTTDRAGIAASTYQQRDIETADPLSLVLRVLALGSLHIARARAALASGDIASKGRAVHGASRCISLLQSSLDMKDGGEVSRNLDRVYTYLHRRLTEAHVQNDDSAFAEVAEHLSELSGAWKEVAERRTSSARAEASATPAP